MANLVTQYLQQNALEQQHLERRVKLFNNPEVDISIPFGGTISEIYKWEQKVRSIMQFSLVHFHVRHNLVNPSNNGVWWVKVPINKNQFIL